MKRWLVIALTSMTIFGGLPTIARALDAKVEKPDSDRRFIRLEILEVKGSSRLTAEQLTEELGLRPGVKLTDAMVFDARRKLLGLGLFRSALIYQRRGSRPGWAKLVIELEDDPSVLTDWALGGSIGLAYSEDELSERDPETPSLGYRVNLIGRNFFSSLHRINLLSDMDSEGTIREMRFAYGLPRFATEDVQFDFEAAAVDVRSRYLNAMAYSGRVQGLWTTSVGDAELFYGPAMYVNREPRFAFPGFPKSTAGPKLGYLRETRLIRFLPGEGYRYSGSAMYSIFRSHESIFEASGAYTFDFWNYAYLTLQADGLAIGSVGYSFRGENRLDIPIGPTHSKAKQMSNLFFRLRAGADEYKSSHLLGSSAIIGLRYHSPGFIAELSFEITQAPKEFVDQELQERTGGRE